MSEIKNRVSENINRKLLEVKNITRDANGEIAEIVADVTRHNEGTITEPGTPLNAESFAGLEKAINYLFKREFNDGLLGSWIQQRGNLQSKTFRMNINSNDRLNAKVIFDTQYVTCNVINGYDYIELVFSETQELNGTTGSTVRRFDFTVELYKYPAFEIFVVSLEGAIQYINVPIAPLD